MVKFFHYDIIKQLCQWSGYSDEDAETIAYTSAMTDLNTKNYDFTNFRNWRSQFAFEDLFEAQRRDDILQCFHFCPGLSEKPAGRKDGKENKYSVVADSTLANQILDEALWTKDLNRIGIALHLFADSFAHQGFSGKWEKWNSRVFMGLDTISPNIGHGDVGNAPDTLGCYYDHRLGDIIHPAKGWIYCCETVLKKIGYDFSYLGDPLGGIVDLVFDNASSTFINKWDSKEKIEADFENWRAFMYAVKDHKNYCLELFKNNNL